MSLLKEFIAAGLRHLEGDRPGFDHWSSLMVRDLGVEVEPRLREVRQWSLLLAYQRSGPRQEKKNCWEQTRCGREVRGEQSGKIGVCPAAVESRLDGMHGGKNGGRACWVIENTRCRNGAPDRPRSSDGKRARCRKCLFYREVREQEGADFMLNDEVLLALLY